MKICQGKKYLYVIILKKQTGVIVLFINFFLKNIWDQNFGYVLFSKSGQCTCRTCIIHIWSGMGQLSNLETCTFDLVRFP